MHITDPSTRDLLAEIDATLKLGRERHLDFRERAFDLLVRLRPLVEREERLPEVTMPDHDTCIAIGEMARDLMTGRIQYDGHIIEATLLWLEAEGKIRLTRREEPKP